MARLDKTILAHNCFPFTLSITKFHTKTPYESRICTVDWFFDRWTEYDETWQNLMSSTKYFWRSDSISWHLIGWDILVPLTDGSSALFWLCVVRISPYVPFTFLTSPKRWTEFEETLQEARNRYPLPMFVFFGQIVKIRWLSRPLIGWDIFYFSATDFVAISSRHHRFRNTHDNILIKLLPIFKTIYCYDFYIWPVPWENLTYGI